jgi:hypothetical protein
MHRKEVPMHSFLRTIGFGNLTRLEEQDQLLKDVLTRHDFKKIVEGTDGHLYAEISKEFAPDIGITVFGEYDKDNLFHMDYYFPFFWGSQVTSYEQCSIEKHMANMSFAAACDDMRMGTTMIFYVSNAAEFMSVAIRENLHEAYTSVSLAGLAESGTILLPVKESMKAKTMDPEKIIQRNNLYNAAQSGDEEAIESLTMEDIDTYSMLTRRVQNEDIYTIVDSYFMPYGMECELYSVMGDITDCISVYNNMTNEKIWKLGLLVNDLPMDVVVNAADLLGEPEVGRRFKGVVWLQGKINFQA